MSFSEQLPLLGGVDALLSADLPPEDLEAALAKMKVGPVIAIDEAGRGPLAGPVTAGAVIFDGPCDIEGINDSKQLSPKKRAALVPLIQQQALAWGVGCASAEEIDDINILKATQLAAMRAISACGVRPAIALTDALKMPALACPVMPIIKGDARVRAIGAASILAKEHRDDLMRRAEEQWPGYGLAGHKGYPSKMHREAIIELGSTTFHRLTFNGARPDSDRPLAHSLAFQRWETELREGRSGEEVLAEAEAMADLLPECEMRLLREMAQ